MLHQQELVKSRVLQPSPRDLPPGYWGVYLPEANSQGTPMQGGGIPRRHC